MNKFDRDKIYWWSPKRRLFGLLSGGENFGDLLGPYIVEHMLNLRHKSVDQISVAGKLLSIGSVMHFANSGDVVWGSGINGKISLDELNFDSLDIRAVRGPETASILRGRGLSVPEIYGDPGVLTSIFWPRNISPVSGKVVYIPHFRESEEEISAKGVSILHPRLPVDVFIDKLQEAEKVITTSLHGYILAESYGIPAVLLENTSGETDFKYRDYFLGTGRNIPILLNSLDEAMDVDGVEVDLGNVQKALIDSFPYDIFS